MIKNISVLILLMKLIEQRNKLALETAKLVFENNINAIFLGGTALNTFYVNYRLSEDVDFGYTNKTPKSKIEEILRESGYIVEKTSYKFRDVTLLKIFR